MAADRLVQEHIDSYGVDSLLTRSEEPFTTEELIALLKLPYGTRAGHLVLRDNLEWQGVQVMIALYCTMGPFKKPSPLTRARRSGRASYLYGTSPGGCSACCSERLHTVHNLMAIALGDMLYVTLCPCKSDPTGTKHGNSPVPSACHPTRPINLAWEAACYEIIRQMPPAERKRAPLVLGPGGKSWSKVGLDTFKELIRHIASPESHRQLSVYSFRVWLAYSILAAGATPEQIMLLLRWSSTHSARKLYYARLGERAQASLLVAARGCPLDKMRAHILHSVWGAAAGAAEHASTEGMAAQRPGGVECAAASAEGAQGGRGASYSSGPAARHQRR